MAASHLHTPSPRHVLCGVDVGVGVGVTVGAVVLFGVGVVVTGSLSQTAASPRAVLLVDYVYTGYTDRERPRVLATDVLGLQSMLFQGHLPSAYAYVWIVPSPAVR